jgi:prolyl-tRNA synthetase
LRVELGPRDLESGQVAVSRRDGLAVAGIADPGKPTAKLFLPNSEFVRRASDLLDSIQQHLYDRALAFRNEHTRIIDTKKEFYDFFTPKDLAKPEIHGGFALAHWNGSRAVEEQIKNDLKVTIRCIPLDDPANPPERGTCAITGESSPRRVLWAKSY